MIMSIGAIIASFSTIMGLLSGFIPNFIKYVEMKAQHKHELELLRLKIEAASRGIELEAVVNDGASARDHDTYIAGSGPMETLRASVRPVITYSFFLLFMIVKLSVVALMFTKGANTMDIINTVWDAYTMAIFGSVIGFWFGTRAMTRLNDDITTVVKKGK